MTLAEVSPQLTAFFTSAPILASSAAVNSFSAKAVGHMAPSSRFAASLKPNVAYAKDGKVVCYFTSAHKFKSRYTAGKVDAIRATGATAILLDVLDRAAVKDTLTNAMPEVVVHQSTALAAFTDFRKFDEGFAMTNRLRTEGTDNLIAAMKELKIHRLVAQSYAGWPNARTGGPVKTEDDPLDQNPPSAVVA